MTDTPENLLSHEVIKIIYEEGAKFLCPERAQGFARIRGILAPALQRLGADLATATTRDFRRLYQKAWTDVLEDLVPFETKDRVTERFRALVF